MATRRRSREKAEQGVPTREAILQFVAENPGRTGKREIARAFGVKGDERSDLKKVLTALKREGLLQKEGKKLRPAGELPRVSVLDVFGRDSGGGLLARPVAWDEVTDGPQPTICITAPSGGRAITAGVGDRVLARVERVGVKGVDYEGRVIRRLDRKQNRILGVLRIDDGRVRLEPAARGQGEIEVEPDSAADARDGDLAEVEITRSAKFGLSRGRVCAVIGSMKSERAISLIAIHARGIPHIFCDRALEEAARMRPLTAPFDDAPHEDWRDLPLITIDPSDARDHDDAVHAMADPDAEGGIIATVAIADVGWYVRPGTALDSDALLRGNSVYFPDRVVPMLPERISNDLCSLRENEDRPAIAVRMWFDAAGRKVRHRFHRIIMRSHARLAYPQAQGAIDGRPDEKTKPLLSPVLQPLWQAWQCMNRGRGMRAPLELDLPERKLILGDDDSVQDILTPERLDAHRLIEEFMIQANVCAAETLEDRKQRLVYRVHDQPSLAKLESLREFLKSMNLSLVRAGNIRASHFNTVLGSVSGTDREDLVNQIVLRTQSQAEYSPRNIGHFGLNLLRYAHFTSPIRRYADLIVHRALIAALDFGEGGITAEQESRLDEIAADISVAERRAMTAERETVDRLIAAYLSEKIGSRFRGKINGVTRAGLFVTLTESGADGFVPIAHISDDYYHFDEASYVLVGEASGLAYQIGQEVEVRLVEAAPIAGALRFEMLSDGKPYRKVSRTLQSNRPNRRRTFSKRGRPPGGKKKH
jgi:ribonuclease R